MNSIKSFQALKVKHHLARMLVSIWRKTQRHTGGYGVCFGGFNCRSTCANILTKSLRGEFVKGSNCLRLKSKDETSLSPVQITDSWPGDIGVSIDSCPFTSLAVSLQPSADLWTSYRFATRCCACHSHHSCKEFFGWHLFMWGHLP